MLALTIIPFWGIYRGIAGMIAQGSPMAYLAVVPVWAAMLAYGFRAAPRGVGDPESDWILAAVFGGLGLFLRHLMSHRFPTLSGLWQLPLVGAVLWAACLAAVLFGVRRVMQTWGLWVFMFGTATPLPYLLATSALGGGAVAASAVTGVLGAVAVAISGTLCPMRRRLSAAAGSCIASVGVGLVAGGAGIERSPHGILFVTILTGAAIPFTAFVVLQSRASGPAPATRATLPERSLVSVIALGLSAVLVYMLNRPFSMPESPPGQADATWSARANLSESQSFPFIQHYLGRRATFTRYVVPSMPDLPEAAVDVIATDNFGALRTYRDAIWYPATTPPNYVAFALGNEAVRGVRSAATDSSLATSGSSLDWYIVTWMWKAGDDYQQVFVVVNQTWTSHDPPPAPIALSLRANVIGPALWLARQQPDPSIRIDPQVATRAQQVVARVMAAGESHDD